MRHKRKNRIRKVAATATTTIAEAAEAAVHQKAAEEVQNRTHQERDRIEEKYKRK